MLKIGTKIDIIGWLLFLFFAVVIFDRFEYNQWVIGMALILGWVGYFLIQIVTE